MGDQSWAQAQSEDAFSAGVDDMFCADPTPLKSLCCDTHSLCDCALSVYTEPDTDLVSLSQQACSAPTQTSRLRRMPLR